MNFGEALEQLKQGKRVKRSFWGGYWKIESYELYSTNEYGEMIIAFLKDGGYAPAQPYQADLLADDWEVIE